MLKFSAPDDNLVKAVIIDKNRKRGLRFFICFAVALLVTLVYGFISAVVFDYYTVKMLFSNYVFTSLVLFTVTIAVIGVIITFRPVLKKEVFDNGHYDIAIEEKGIRITFLEDSEVFVSRSKITSVVELDDCFVISVFKGKDEIVCKKSNLVEGDISKIYDIFSTDYGVCKIVRRKRSIVSTILYRRKNNNAVTSLICTGLALLLSFPCLWFALVVLIGYIPEVMPQIVGLLGGVKLYAQILLGVALLPVAIIITIIEVATSLVVVLMPLLTFVASIIKGVAVIKEKKTALGVVCLCVSLLAAVGVAWCLSYVLLLI